MALVDVLEKDFWVLSPYCFCEDRKWLTVGDLYHTGGIHGNGEDGGGLAAISGLSREDTALLAALLTAFALFLFLLFLLLCCLYPWGLCDRTSKEKGDLKKKSTEIKTDMTTTTSDGVNLTAVDLKIPRAWTDSQEGMSESELARHRLGWDNLADIDEVDWRGGRGGLINEGYQGQHSVRDSSWFSRGQLDDVFGTGSVGKRKGGYSYGTEDIYTGVKSQQTKSTHLSRSLNQLDSIMSYGHDDSRHHGNAVEGYKAHAYRNDDDAGSVVEALTLTRTKALIRPASRSDGNDITHHNMTDASSLLSLSGTPKEGQFASITAQCPYPKEHEDRRELTRSNAAGYVTSVASSEWDGNASNGSAPRGSNQSGEIIQEYRSTFRRTVEETTTSG